jgi:tripartite-type tricarboxylate transporter receptor subunit TctC
MTRIVFRAGAALLIAALLALPAAAQSGYPDRPIRLIVPFAAGGTSDVLARILQQGLAERLGQPVVIQNRAGASGNIGMDAAARSAPDGYTVFLGNIGAIAINPAVFRDMAISPGRDFIAITEAVDVAHALVVTPTLPVKTIAELVAYGKANPGVLNFGSTGSGSLSHLELEEFRRAAGIDIVHVPYKGGAGPAANALIAGEVHAMYATLSSVLGHIQSGRLRALGISTPKRIDALPQVPTMAEAGFPGMTGGSWQGFFVPADTPRPIVDRLHAAVVAALTTPETAQRLTNAGMTVVTSRSPEAFAAYVNAEIARWGKVVRESGATVD